jgi:hypothetical protein
MLQFTYSKVITQLLKTDLMLQIFTSLNNSLIHTNRILTSQLNLLAVTLTTQHKTQTYVYRTVNK